MSLRRPGLNACSGRSHRLVSLCLRLPLTISSPGYADSRGSFEQHDIITQFFHA
jgi:hypothetical protein